MLIVVFSLATTVASSATQIIPGTPCKIMQQKSTYQNQTYTCTKYGKKLLWSRGIAIGRNNPSSVVPSPRPIATPSPTKSSSPSPTVSSAPQSSQVSTKPSDFLDFKGAMIYDIRGDQIVRRANSGIYFDTDSRSQSNFENTRIKAYQELNRISGNRTHPNIDFQYSISDSFPKFLVEYTKRELDEAAALWDSFIGRKITVYVYMVTEQDRDSIKSNRWLQANLPDSFKRFDSKLERPFITGGGGYWRGENGWSGNIYLGTASYLDPTYVNYEWPQVARHEVVHLIQDFAFARNGRLREDSVQFEAIQPQNFREGSANAISYLTSFRNVGWSSDAMDWLIWQRAENTKNWKTVNSLAEVRALMNATEFGTPEEAFEQSYAVGALMYEWLIGTYGFDSYKKIIQEFSTVSNFGQAVQSALGIQKEVLYDQMAEYIFKSYQRVYGP